MPILSHLTSCTPTKSNLYLANSLAAAVIEPTLYRHLTFHVLIPPPFSAAYVLPEYHSSPRLLISIDLNAFQNLNGKASPKYGGKSHNFLRVLGFSRRGFNRLLSSVFRYLSVLQSLSLQPPYVTESYMGG